MGGNTFSSRRPEEAGKAAWSLEYVRTLHHHIPQLTCQGSSQRTTTATSQNMMRPKVQVVSPIWSMVSWQKSWVDQELPPKPQTALHQIQETWKSLQDMDQQNKKRNGSDHCLLVK